MKRNRPAKFKALFLLFLMVLQALTGYACVADPVAIPFSPQQNAIHLPSGHRQADCCTDNRAQQINPDQLLNNPVAERTPYPSLLFLYPPPSFILVFLRPEKVMPRHISIPRQQQVLIPDIRIAIQSFQI